ncbi:hypothetical protein BST27_24225 [Mycobacterium intermedium]|uniref:VTT domain-containing protein n=1 Tax=Mycobacterium intermedium TaxID=28445 RepID=A0A1E3SJW2_MYCIE|nr:DedA family protein [Mycobacterium intermedium]MCV6965584.1 DedA family protein [Mycobacterium intermedium]ODR02450.1 hypothetical protein BHQ20_05105 [Mycobacterium intermedium]OPE51611.1 hypothetical protein BV508_05725 [Mycobacterium intermedium]ORA96796.1 hypothetical protein BST27_24225 [Mycobacterium intermedium]
MFDSLLDTLGRSWWEYPLVLAICGFDAVIPVLPSETVLLTAGILAADGSMVLALVIGMAAIGGFLGDNLAYAIGNSADERVHRWFARGRKRKARLEWAQRELDRHGGPLVMVARFVPGGRTATTVSCGMLDFPYRTFLVFDAIGSVLWATLNTGIGFVGGHAFEDRPFVAFAVSFTVALALGGSIELFRRMRRQTRAQQARAESPAQL